MAERLRRLPDAELEVTLRALSGYVDWPAATAPDAPGSLDLAAAVRARIETTPAEARGSATRGLLPLRGGWTWRPARRALLVAVAALLALAALAGAVGLGLPGLRLILGEPSASPPPALEPTPAPGGSGSVASPEPGLGASMGLGEAFDPDDGATLDTRAGFPVARPTDPLVGAPEAIYIDDRRGGQVTLLWPAGDVLPATRQRDVGLLLSEFIGTVGEGFYNKVIGGGTPVEAVTVDGERGFWIDGDPHVFFWEGPDGMIDDQRRWVGDVLIWSDGTVTYRLESALGRDEAIRIAESVR
jgi:hypothetical protein